MKALLLSCLFFAFGVEAHAQETKSIDPEVQRGVGEAPDVPESLRPRARGLSGPDLGFYYSSEAGLRMIRGVPGAASVGSAVEGVPTLREWVVSAERRYVLGIRADDGRVALAGSSGVAGGGAEMPEIGAVSGPLATSPDGRSAVVWDAAKRELTVLEGLANTPSVAWKASLDTVPGEVSALAVRDGGDAVLVAAGSALLQFEREGTWRQVAAVQGSVNLLYLRGSDDAIYLDAAVNQMYRIRNSEAGLGIFALAGESDGIKTPVAIGLSADNRRAFIANSEPAEVVSVPIEEGVISALPSSCVPTRLTRLSGNAVFRLGTAANGAICLYDGDQAAPRTLFIPPPTPGAGSGGGQ